MNYYYTQKLSRRLCANKESILIAALCAAALPFAQGGALIGGVTASLLVCSPLVFTLSLYSGEGQSFMPMLGGVGVLVADAIAGPYMSGGLGPALYIAAAVAAAAVMGVLAGILEAMLNARQRGIAPLSSLVICGFFIGPAMLLPFGGADFAALKLALYGIEALICARMLLALSVALAFAYMLFCSIKKAPVPFEALAAILLMSGAGMALTFHPGIERMLSETSYSLYTVLMLVCGAIAPYQILRLILLRLVYKRPLSPKSGLRALMIAAAVYLYCSLSHNGAMLGGIELNAAALMIAGFVPALAAAARYALRSRPARDGGKASLYKARMRSGALMAAGAVPTFLLLAVNTGEALSTGQIAQHTLYALAAVCLCGADAHDIGASRAALGALLFYTLKTAAPLASAALYGSAGIGGGFSHMLALGIISAAAARQRYARQTSIKVLGARP